MSIFGWLSYIKISEDQNKTLKTEVISF